MFYRYPTVVAFLLSIFSFSGATEQVCNEDGARTMPLERYVIFDNNYYVRDRVTGLEWTRCAIGQSWDETNKQCQEITKKQVKSWFTYQGAIKEVARFRQLTKDNEWRLPTINELLTIVEHRCQSPAINTAVFPNTPSWRFWSISPMTANDQYAWVTDFEDGSSKTILKSVSSHYIRLVRGNSVLLNKPKTTEEKRQEDLQRWNDGVHALTNPDVTKLQTYEDTLSFLPKDSSGHPDWAKALNQQLIEPRSHKYADQAEQMIIWQQDIIYKDTATMPWVVFPHKTHTQWLSCKNCHEKLFSSSQNKANISMASIYMGNHCGACHGRVAFNVNTCERCHSIAHDGMGENGRKMLEKPQN
ncbi:DUF1566 domain-containing protein [Thalassotalea sp. G2M2-11]|uniref:Lcl domain-containing protein n=1 Tax=Thalassotalea sp. G2M2-11 TaxID=2787627 RepID=UPI0019D13E7C|nr:DUF1566 domain-containing protein [Thalassotalea sp. G2M2-11]